MPRSLPQRQKVKENKFRGTAVSYGTMRVSSLAVVCIQVY